MSETHVAAKAGALAIPGFLDGEACAWLRAEVRAASRQQARVAGADRSAVVDTRVRSTKLAEVSREAVEFVAARVLALQPRLERHFSIALGGCQPPQFLVYGEGDSFRPHRDSSHDHEAPQHVQERKVSVVLFLNGEADAPAPDQYSGGSLAFYYQALDGLQWKVRRLPVRGEEGLLIAFPPELVHEVTPVTAGERYTVVSWFF